MAHYLKYFETENDFELYLGSGGEQLFPNVIFINDLGELIFNPDLPIPGVIEPPKPLT